MTKSHYLIFAWLLMLSACQSGNLENLLDLPESLKESSALEYTYHDRLLWTIQDAGNPNYLYAMDAKGELVKTIEIDNAENIDWEDLASDKEENVYIGDFGNNKKKRENFTIYKITKPGKATERASAEKISFTLPNTVPPQDFEAFFLYKEKFYIFSKDKKEVILVSVANKIGDQIASLVTKFKLKGKNNYITAADVSVDGKTVVLLNHDKLWKLTGFKSDNFFEANVEAMPFNHTSQKEGIVFITNNEVLISDELDDHEGGNLYHFDINSKGSKQSSK